MLIYFDTEFEGLYRDANLISMGFVSETGKKLYVEFSDIDEYVQDAWIQDNVLKNTVKYGELTLKDLPNDTQYYCSSKYDIKDKLVEWLLQFNEQIYFVTDVGHYDFVFLIDLFGSAFDLPKFITPTYYDINQDIAKHYNCSLMEAFDKSREDILKEYNINVEGLKHNSLYDAEVIKELYKILLH